MICTVATLRHQNMNGNDYSRELSILIKNYIILEKQINTYISRITNQYCCNCCNTCCREDICRETVDSVFLELLIQKQNLKYDTKKGWLSPKGCRLIYGRPLICYEFFCEKIIRNNKFQKTGVEKLVKMFDSVGQRAYGSQHLICIPSIEKLSKRKIDKINGNIVKMINHFGSDQSNDLIINGKYLNLMPYDALKDTF